MLISSFSGGGAEGVFVSVANGLAERGWGVTLIVLNVINQAKIEKIAAGVDVRILNINHARHVFIYLALYLQKTKIRQILVFNYELAIILVLIKRFFGFETKIIARNINTLSEKYRNARGFKYRFLVVPMIKILYPKVDHVINQCEAMRVDLINLYPQLAKKTSVINNPIARHLERESQLNRVGSKFIEPYILCVGGLYEKKDFHTAILIFSKLAQIFPELRLKLIGDGPLEKSLKEYAKELKVFERVDFEGFRPNIGSYYQSAKCTILTSLYEGFPNVLLESIVFGTPVIAFNCPSGPNEIIVNGVNGYLIEDRNVDLFLEKAIALVDDGLDRCQVRKTALCYNADAIVEKYNRCLILQSGL